MRILIVDDEPKNLTALESILEAEDRQLVRAESGFEALRHLLDGEFALIILDVNMPGMDGFETAELIREREQSRDTPIIFLTGAVGSDFAVTKGYGLGAVDYLVKPVDADILRFKVAVFADLFRKTAEAEQQAEALEEAHALLNSVLDGATENAIAAVDADGRAVMWNEGARRIYGYPPEAMVGQHLGCLFVEQDGPLSLDALLERARRVGGTREECSQRRANGRTFPGRVTLTPRLLADGTAAGYVFIAVDITDRKEAESARVQLAEERVSRLSAEREQQRLQQLLDVLPGPVLVTDAAGRLTGSNAAARELLGDIPVGTDFLQNRVDGWMRLQADGAPYAVERVPMARALLGRETVHQEQMVLRHEDGREVPVLANAAPVFDADGALTAGVIALHDISTLKDLERQKDDFLAAVSHDLRSPLTVISGKAQLLSRRTSRIGSEEAVFFNDFLRSIDRTAKRAAGMVNELMDVARMQMNRPLQLECSEVDLATVVRNVVADLQTTTDGHQIELATEVADLVGAWDGPRLERVTVNLIDNAIKYSPAGGNIAVRLWADDDQDGGRRSAWLQVTDSGMGIGPDELPRIFERFYRAGNVVGRVEGSGIGLAAARKVVEEHGGEISLESTEGIGTTVTVRLPLEAVPIRGGPRPV